MAHAYDRRKQADAREASYALAICATVYSLLLVRLCVKEPRIYPMVVVFADD